MLYSRVVYSLQRSFSFPSSSNIIQNVTTSITRTSITRTSTAVFPLSRLSVLSETCKTCRGSGSSPSFNQLLCNHQKNHYRHSAHRFTTMADKRSKCIFCKICDDTSKEGTEKLLYSDDDIVVFRDIYPAAKHHYLVVSRDHIPTVKSLTKEQNSLLEKMISMAKQTLEKEGADMSDVQLGFHWPPFHSVEHLHLHAISPTREMSFVKRMIFKENSWWFVSSSYVLSLLGSD